MLTVERAKQKLLWDKLIAFDVGDLFGVFEYSHEDNKLYLTLVNEKTGESWECIYNDIDKLDNLVKELHLELYEVRINGDALERVKSN